MLKFIGVVLLISTAYGALLQHEFPKVFQEIAQRVHDECRLITGATEAEIDAVRNGDFSGGSRIRQYNACAWLHVGSVDSKSHPNYLHMQTLEPEKLKGWGAKLYGDCAIKGKNSASTFVSQMWEASKCAYDYNPELFILV